MSFWPRFPNSDKNIKTNNFIFLLESESYWTLCRYLVLKCLLQKRAIPGDFCFLIQVSYQHDVLINPAVVKSDCLVVKNNKELKIFKKCSLEIESKPIRQKIIIKSPLSFNQHCCAFHVSIKSCTKSYLSE